MGQDAVKIDFEWIRWQMILAVAAAGGLRDRLVLKGGNALNLVHRVGSRTSLDVDYSMADGFADLAQVRRDLLATLTVRYAERGIVPIDFALEPKPAKAPTESKWGGYSSTFKLVDRRVLDECKGDLDAARRKSLPIGSALAAKHVFKIEISKHEHCEAKETREHDGFSFFVNSLPMIAAEKLRAICQQMDGYEGRRNKKPRARDFYDIHAVVRSGVVLTAPENKDLVRAAFEAKEVPLAFLGDIENSREFHEVDWPAVANSIAPFENRGFDFYFDFVVREVIKLEPLWIVNPP
ncbi:MAG: nucleotidyl transferase AbiEii/AbiGii toxin family protein [Planctomycetes bacterium]|nr:nucleotidyl transferase AbiEii/AbiGii toxin family protein [Planctomycetota bacterium]